MSHISKQTLNSKIYTVREEGVYVAEEHREGQGMLGSGECILPQVVKMTPLGNCHLSKDWRKLGITQTSLAVSYTGILCKTQHLVHMGERCQGGPRPYVHRVLWWEKKPLQK